MKKKTDPVNPNHYRNNNNVQLIELIRLLPFSIGNALKYVYRCNNKESQKQDLEKALWYLNDFYNNPLVTSKDNLITKKLLDTVFDDIESFEREACEALMEMYFSVHNSDFAKKMMKVNRIITNKAAEL